MQTMEDIPLMIINIEPSGARVTTKAVLCSFFKIFLVIMNL